MSRAMMRCDVSPSFVFSFVLAHTSATYNTMSDFESTVSLSSSSPSTFIQSTIAMAESPSTRNAGPPFDDADADIIIRSCDNVEFRLHKTMLWKASTTFSDMFPSHPLPPNSRNDTQPTSRDGLPITALSEDGRTLDHLFRLIYPVDNPKLSSMDDVRSTLEVLEKYRVDAFPRTIEQTLLKAAEAEPEAVYALACRYKLRSIAQTAARMTLRKPIAVRSMDASVSGAEYRRLVQYQTECIRAAVAAVQTFTWASVDVRRPAGGEEPVTKCQCRRHGFAQGAGPHPTQGPSWLMDYRLRCCVALQRRPVGTTVMERDLLLSVLNAKVCQDCRKWIPGPFKEFSKHLAAEIDLRMMEVKRASQSHPVLF
ncbi:hypothetical protein BV25DRAFT_1428056 [Artomyces pyxidatus]|uniref:Uncharacterized protein n=1 Tax=Artomyces pyxidatus TaxID=48021 RepID=A0ACB8SNG5_9AGAM|nr:hypothetical protein BV25DRAFT_1428056 [Artomyces pyxidatus]